MSSHTWTQDALQSELRPLQVPAWRLVEAQHVVSTLSLVDNLDEQNLLEDILEETKPPVPAECRHLDYLLSTPFRYRPYPYGSRFRKAGLTPGVWYGAEQPETAVAEMVFYRYLFYAEGSETPFPDNPADYTLHRPSNQPIFTSIFDKTYLNQYVEEISGAICDSPYGCEFRLG